MPKGWNGRDDKEHWRLIGRNCCSPGEKGCPLCRLGIRGESGSEVKVGSILGAVQEDSVLSLPDAGKAASLSSLWLCHRHLPVMPECVEKALWKTSRLA